MLRRYDVVQGVRWRVSPKGKPDGPLWRLLRVAEGRSDNTRKAIVSLVNYWVIRLLYGVPFHDFQNVTFYPTALIQSVTLRGRTSFINPECLLRAVACGARFVEVPIDFIPRTVGEAKGTRLSSILRSVKDILSNWLAWGWRYRLTVGPGSGKQIESIREPGSLHQDVVRPKPAAMPTGRMNAQ